MTSLITITSTGKRDVTYGPLTLSQWAIGADQWVEVRSITDKVFDRHRIEQAADALFPEGVLFADDIGALVRLHLVAPLLYATGLESLATHLPHLPDAIDKMVRTHDPLLAKSNVVEPIVQELPVSLGQIQTMRELLDAGHTRANAARAVSLDRATAGFLVRGILPMKRVAVAARDLYRLTFVQSRPPRKRPGRRTGRLTPRQGATAELDFDGA